MSDQNQHIYVITGETGAYSDHTEWLMCATMDEDEARRIVDECNQWCRDNALDYEAKGRAFGAPFPHEKVEAARKAIDPDFSHWGYGTEYQYRATPLK